LSNGVALFVLALALVALATSASAQEHLVRQNGVYLYNPQPADRSGIERAIEDAVSQMSVHMSGNTLYQKLEGSQGTRYHEFHFREDGSVSVWTRIESEHLPMRVSYNLQYHRAP
jgi:hypothetical protein